MNQPDETTQVLSADAWRTLQSSHADYKANTSQAYDEVLNEVANRIAAAGSIGKADIGALLFWKRLRANTPWVSQLMIMPDTKVRALTKGAVLAVNDISLAIPEAAAAGRGALSGLPGFKTGDALASALLLAASPDRMAVYDRRARAGLKILNLTLSAAPGRYGRYMKLVQDLQSTAARYGQTWTPRDVDIALYWLGDPKRKP